MLKINKQILTCLCFILFTVVSNTFAVNSNVYNDTGKPIRGVLSYYTDFCNPRNFKLGPGQSQNFETGICAGNFFRAWSDFENSDTDNQGLGGKIGFTLRFTEVTGKDGKKYLSWSV